MVFKYFYTYVFIGVFSVTALGPAPATARESGREPVAVPASGEAPAAAGDGHIGQEIDALRKEMKEKPGDTTAIRLGQLLLKKGDLDGAMLAFDEALRMNPRSFEARTGKGAVLGRRGDTGEAEKVLRDALVMNPHPAKVHYELGMLCEKKGDYAGAIAEYREGIRDQEERGDSY